MEKETEKKKSIGVRIIGIIMLAYSLPLIFLPPPSCRNIFERPLFVPFDFATFLNRNIDEVWLRFLIGVVYLVSSFGILKLKKWSRFLAFYFSIFVILIYSLSQIFGTFPTEKSPSPFLDIFFSVWMFVWWIMFAMNSYLLPIFLFLVVLAFPSIKKQFN